MPPRDSPRRLRALLLASAAIALPVVLVSGGNPGAIASWFVGPVSSPYGIAVLLNASGPLALAAVGAVISSRAGTFNLGGEGQAYLGAFAFTVTVGALPASPVSFILAILAAFAASACLASLSSALRRSSGAEELITSFLLSVSIVYILDWVIAGPLSDPSSAIVGMGRIPAHAELPRLSGAVPLTPAFGFALAAAVLLYAFLTRSGKGFSLDLAGKAPLAAAYAGLDVARLRSIALAFSGGLHGLAGALLVSGSFLRLARGSTAGIGWNALAVALVGRLHPLLVVAAALLFSWTERGAGSAMLTHGIPESLAYACEGLLFLFMSLDSASSRRKGAMG